MLFFISNTFIRNTRLRFYSKLKQSQVSKRSSKIHIVHEILAQYTFFYFTSNSVAKD